MRAQLHFKHYLYNGNEPVITTASFQQVLYSAYLNMIRSVCVSPFFYSFPESMLNKTDCFLKS